MSTRSERDKGKALQERHQAILAGLLKDEDNKYCVDCDAKGPRWASWNLGIFLCIRCAGIHRNLGVHISKVKSVNLDTWTPEQIAMMQEMGNSRARAVYEANLQDNFRRPQTDSGLEAFIRAKYEQKKYIAREWIPPQPKLPHYVEDDPKKEKKKSRTKASSVTLTTVPSPTKKTTPTPKSEPAAVKKPEPPKQSAAVDLLGLDDTPSNGPTGTTSGDLFGDFISSSTVPNSPSSTVPPGNNHVAPAAPPASNAETLGDVNLFGGVENDGSGTAGITAEAVTGKKSKDSILALYGSSVAGAGPAMPPQQQQQQMLAGGAMQGGMFGGGMMNGMMQPNMMQQPQLQGQLWNGAVPQHPQQQQQQQQLVAAMMGGVAQQPAYNMSAMYGMQQQQPQAFQQHQQFQQMQQQFGGMSLVGNAGNYPQMAAAAAGGGGGQWGGQQPSTGHTLSNNLWQ